METEYLHFLQSAGFSASAAYEDYATTPTTSSSSRCFQYSSSMQSHASSSSIDAMFSGVSLLSLLTSPPTPPPSPPPPPTTTTTATTGDPHHHDYAAMTSLLPLDDHLQLPPLDLPNFLHDPICSLSSLANPTPTPTPTFGFFPELASFTATPTPVKPEPFSMDDLNLISSFTNPPPFVFPHLPDLLSLDHLRRPSSSSFHKRPRVLESACSTSTPPNSFYCHPHHYYPPPPPPPPPTPCTVHKTRLVLASSSSSPPESSPPPRRSALARQRRQCLSDKTRCLQKLLPWDKKMNIATVLEEAYKYIKFLQAQLRALQSMPSDSLIVSRAAAAAVDDEDVGAVFSELGRLTRNQLLQVVVNSPVAQTMLYSRGYCVFAEEQLDVLKRFTTQRTMMTSYDSKRFCPDYSYKLA